MTKKTEEPEAPENAAAGNAPAGESVLTVEPGTVTAEQLEELKQRAAKADDHWDRLLRATADFENFRKRAAREKQEAIRYANENLLTRLLTVMDSFEMALAAAQNAQAGSLESLQSGIAMVHQQFKTALADAGVEEVDATGKTFDPNLHEAISQQETADAPEGAVVHQTRKGYKLKDRLIRPASVVVAKPPAAPH